MKLAEALILRAGHQRRLNELRQRLVSNAKVQEGDRPGEDPAALMVEVERVSDELTRLIQNINRTNAATPLDDGMTLSDALALRDALIAKHRIYRALVEAASIVQNVYSRSEVRFEATVNVAEVQARADDLARQHRDLDTHIQQQNWLIDLIEA
jgi:hypothetical protein